MTTTQQLTSLITNGTDNQIIDSIVLIEDMAITQPHHRLVKSMLIEEFNRRNPELGQTVLAMMDDESFDHISSWSKLLQIALSAVAA